MKEFEDIAIKFRSAILSIEKDRRPIGLQEFPNGSCGDASRLLGTYLEEKGLRSAKANRRTLTYKKITAK